MSPDPTSALVALAALAVVFAAAFVVGRRQKRARARRRAERAALASERGWEFEAGPRMWPLEGLKQLETFEWLHDADANDLASTKLAVGRLVLFDLEWVTVVGAHRRTDRNLVLRVDGDWGEPFVARSGLPFHERHPKTTVEVHGNILALTCDDTPPDLDAWVDDALALVATLSSKG